MSKNKPVPQEAPMFAADVRVRERRRRFLIPFWQLLSFLLHSAAFVALVLFTPLREIAIPEPKQREPLKINAERLERLAEDLRTVRLNELLEQLNALQIILHNMDVMKQAMMEDYDAFAAMEQKTAKASLEELLTRTIEQQTAAVEAQTRAREAAGTIASLQVRNIADTNLTRRISETLASVEPAFASIDSAQAVSQNLLDKVYVAAELVGLAKTAEAAEVVRDVQLKANTLQREHQINLSSRVKAIADHPNVLKEIQKKQAKLQEHTSNLARLDEKAATEQSRGLGKALRSTEKALRKNQRLAKSNAAGSERDARRRDRLKSAIEQTRAEIDDLKQRRVEVEKLAKSTAEAQTKGQEDAIAAQQDLIKKVEAIAELARLEEAELKPMAKDAFEPDSLTTRAVAQLDIVDAYEMATEMEARITESYREIKSAEAAILRKMSYKAAEKITDVAKTVRPEIDPVLLKKSPRDSETFARQKAAAMEVVQEADGIVDTSEMLMLAAQEIVRPEMPGGATETASRRLQRMYEIAGLNEQLFAAAAEDEVEQAKDLSRLMAESYAAAETGQESEKVPAVPVRLAKRPALKTPAPMKVPELTSGSPDLFPGNIIDLGTVLSGIPTQWMYVNSWYVIGPFPNPDRINLRRRFPPESVVDLEATYIGKNELPVKWEFEQGRSSLKKAKSRALVIPRTSEQYGIWYAYALAFVSLCILQGLYYQFVWKKKTIEVLI